MTRRVNVWGSCDFCSIWKSIPQAWLYFSHVSSCLQENSDIMLFFSCSSGHLAGLRSHCLARFKTLTCRKNLRLLPSCKEAPRATVQSLGPCLVLVPLQRQAAAGPSDTMAGFKALYSLGPWTHIVHYKLLTAWWKKHPSVSVSIRWTGRSWPCLRNFWLYTVKVRCVIKWVSRDFSSHINFYWDDWVYKNWVWFCFFFSSVYMVKWRESCQTL